MTDIDGVGVCFNNFLCLIITFFMVVNIFFHAVITSSTRIKLQVVWWNLLKYILKIKKVFQQVYQVPTTESTHIK